MTCSRAVIINPLMLGVVVAMGVVQVKAARVVSGEYCSNPITF